MAAFHNPALAQAAALCAAFTDAEVLAIKPGDLIEDAGAWHRVESVSFTQSVCGWPVANVVASGVECPTIGASLCISRATPARRVRFSQSQAA